MRILFLHSNRFDYLSVSVFHGLRSLIGSKCVDFPRFDLVYKDYSVEEQSLLRGKGFTLSNLFFDNDELTEYRKRLPRDIGKFSHVIISDLRDTNDLAFRIINNYPNIKIVLLDGSDYNGIFPFEAIKQNFQIDSRFFKRKYLRFVIFKRELDYKSKYGSLSRYIAESCLERLFPRANLNRISFSIPSEKIRFINIDIKEKMFTKQIVDEEVAIRFPDSEYIKLYGNSYKFSCEKEYYHDLQISKFGITGKRAGWDSLRHYEMAANGCVLCFKDLDKKPIECAPHGLNSTNCIIYTDYNNLIDQISRIDSDAYTKLLRNTYLWALSNSTVMIARDLINLI